MFDNKYFDGSGSGGGSLAPGVTPVVGGTEHAILYIDSALMQGSANFTYDGSNVTLTDGWFRSARTYDDYTYGNQILYGFNSSSTIANLTEGYGAITHYGMNVSMTVSATNMKRQQTLYGSKTTISCYDGMVDETVYAYGWFRISGTANVLAGETVTVGTVTYTFVAALAAEGDILIGSTQFESLSRLAAAINGTGTYGVDHQVTAANADATCTGVYSTTVNLKAVAIGVAGESVALAETSGRLTRSAATLLRKSASSYTGVYGQDVSIDVQKASLTGAIGYRAIINVGTSTADQTCNVIRGIETQVAVNAVDATIARGTMHGAYFGAYVNGGLMTNVYGLEIDMTLQNDGATSFSAVNTSIFGIKVNIAGSCLPGTVAGDACALYLPDFSIFMATRTYGIMQLGVGLNYLEGVTQFLQLQTGGVVTAATGTGQLGLVTDAAGYLTSDGSGNLSFAAITVGAAGNDTNVQYNDGGALAGADTFTFDDTNIILTLARVANDALGPNLILQQSRGAAGQDADVIGTIAFNGYNDDGTPDLLTFGTIKATIYDATTATPCGKLSFSIPYNAYGGPFALAEVLTIGGSVTSSRGGGTAIPGAVIIKMNNQPYHNGGLIMMGETNQTTGIGFMHGFNVGQPYVAWLANGYDTTYRDSFTFVSAQNGIPLLMVAEDSAETYARFYNNKNTALGVQIDITKSRAGAAGVAADVLGTISFKGYNDKATPELINYGSIISEISSPVDGTEYGKITIAPTWRGYINDPTRDQCLHIGYDASWPGLGCVVLGNYTTPASVGANYFIVAASDGAGYIVRSPSDLWKIWTTNTAGSELEIMGGLGGNPIYMTFMYGNIGIFGGKAGNVDPTDRGTLRFGQSSQVPAAITADVVKVWAADYAAGDNRLYIMGEKNTNKLALGAGCMLLDSSLADDSESGITFVGMAGENLVRGNVCYRKSDGKYWKADADAATTMPGVAIAIGTINADTTGEFLSYGFFRDDSAFNFTVGVAIYVDTTTAGLVTETAPTGVGDQVQVLGYAYSADVIFFNPQLVMVEV